MPDTPDDARARALRRGAWPVRRFELGHEPPDDLARTTTPEERLAMMWPLAVEAWSVAGKEIPRGRIQDMPSRLWRDGRPE